MPKLADLLAELKRRRVFRVAVVYAGVAFIIFQIVDATFEPLHLPDWASTLVVVLLALGFPIAVGLAWAFDITEQGVVRTADRDAVTPKRPSRPIFGNLTLAIVAAVAVVVAVWSWWGRPTASTLDKSIAVLPFENFSEDAEDWFSDGITDNIITQLARISDLTVIGRTSVMQYKGTTKRLKEIGRELGVGVLLEGSVQRAGGKVRIVSQLIDAGTERHLWAETYDREVETADIFTLQSDVARSIAKALKVRLSSAETERLARRPTNSTEAYNLYLKGLYFWNKRTGDDILKARDYFHQAIDRDPLYARAYVGLADSYNLLHQYAGLPSHETYPKARAAARKALEIDPDIAEAHTSLAYVLQEHDWDWAEAGKEHRLALELNPNYATGRQWYAEYLHIVGRLDEADEMFHRAMELDPLSAIIASTDGNFHYQRQEYREALASCLKAAELSPPEWNANLLFLASFRLGRYKEAYRYWNEETTELWPPDVAAEARRAYERDGFEGFARSLVESLFEVDDPLWIQVQVEMLSAALGVTDREWVLQYRDRYRERFFDSLEQFYEDKDIALYFMMKTTAARELYGDDPRYRDIRRRMGLP